MKTKVWLKNFESGQVLPIVVMGVFAIIALAALMLDGGMLLSHRRTAQAAADAGALAGAKSLCPVSGKSVEERQDEAREVAKEYVEDRNHAEFILLPDDEQFPNDSTIRVETRVSSPAFFARIFDIVGLTASAAAEANCTITGGAAVNLPIAFPCLEKEYDNGKLIGCKNIKPGTLNIIMDSDATGVYCYDEQNNPDSDIICYDVISESSRGWLSLDGGNQFKNCWLDGDCVPPLALIYPRTWLSHLAGLSASDYKLLKDYYDKDLIIPIYDEESEGKPDPCPTGDICRLREGTGHNAYRIIGFAQFTITCIHETGRDQVNLPNGNKGSVCPFRHELCLISGNNIDGSTSLKSIEGIFTEGTVSFGAGDGTLESGLYVVQLTK